MFSMKPMIRCGDLGALLAQRLEQLRSIGWIWFDTPNALSTEKLSASSGTNDSSVV